MTVVSRIRWTRVETASARILEAAGCGERPWAGGEGSAGGSAGRAGESAGSAETSVRRLRGVAREAAAGCDPLSADWKRNQNGHQRECAETLHEEIVRPFAHCG